jgi:hypothetical protein
MIAWSVGQLMPREAHLYAKGEQPYMQPCGKRGRSGVIVEDGAMIQGQCLRQTIREERSGASVSW